MKTGNDILKDTFDKLPLERPSANFRTNMMVRIAAEAERKRKRETLLNWLIPTIASLFCMAIGGAALWYLGLTKIKIAMPSMHGAGFYASIYSIGAVMLLADYFIRKRIKKNEKQERT